MLYARDVFDTNSNNQGQIEIGMNDCTWYYIS
jgi:hypothetical protein